jgi:uncharacterized membrane protein YoaT (DUF817 family)
VLSQLPLTLTNFATIPTLQRHDVVLVVVVVVVVVTDAGRYYQNLNTRLQLVILRNIQEDQL